MLRYTHFRKYIANLSRSNGFWVLNIFIQYLMHSSILRLLVWELQVFQTKPVITQEPFDLERFAMYFLKWLHLSLENTFKSNLPCIFLSFIVSLKTTLQINTPCTFSIFYQILWAHMLDYSNVQALVWTSFLEIITV